MGQLLLRPAVMTTGTFLERIKYVREIMVKEICQTYTQEDSRFYYSGDMRVKEIFYFTE